MNIDLTIEELLFLQSIVKTFKRDRGYCLTTHHRLLLESLLIDFKKISG